jgi:hypothetical protein
MGTLDNGKRVAQIAREVYVGGPFDDCAVFVESGRDFQGKEALGFSEINSPCGSPHGGEARGEHRCLDIRKDRSDELPGGKLERDSCLPLRVACCLSRRRLLVEGSHDVTVACVNVFAKRSD